MVGSRCANWFHNSAPSVRPYATCSSFPVGVGLVVSFGHRSLAGSDGSPPLIVLLHQQAAGQEDEGLIVGEHPHHVGAPPGLPVDPLQRIGGAQPRLESLV